MTGEYLTKTDDASLQIDPAALDHITISPSSATINAGGTQAYTSEAFDVFGNSRGDVTGLTTFSITPDGSCTGNDCGSTVSGAHTVTGEYLTKTDDASLQIDPAALDHITISPSSATINAGGTQAYTSEAFDVFGNSRGDVTGLTTFSITPDGSCTGNDCGSTVSGAHTVTGEYLTKTDDASLQIDPAALDHITISPSSATINAGGTQAYTSEAFDVFGNSRGDVTGLTTFSITPDGSCTGNDCGSTVSGAHTVTGEYLTKTDDASLQIDPAALDHITISPSSATINAGGTQAYTSEAFDVFGNSRGDVTGLTTFSITPDGSCTGNDCGSTVSGAHTVTGEYLTKTDDASLQIDPAALDHITISPSSATINAGGTQAYTSEAFDVFGNSRGDVTGLTTFSITPDGSCTGNDCGSTVSGAHTVTGEYLTKTDDASLQIDPAALDHITISPSSATINAGGTQAYTSEAFDVFGNSRGDVTGLTTFSITPDGSCTGNDCGSTVSGAHTVTGEYLTKTDDASLQIDPAALDHITISPSSATINAGGTQAYTSEAFDVFGNSRGDVTGLTTFSITPDGSCTGNDCGSTVSGAHTVTGEYLTKTDDASLQIDPAALDHITISPSSATINAGGTQAYTSEAFDVFGNSRGDVTGLTTFSITPDGSCTGNDCGSTVSGAHTVTGEYLTKTDDADLQIDPAALDHITISPSTATINAGGTQAYTSEAFDVYGNSRGDVTGLTTFSITPDGSCALARLRLDGLRCPHRDR